MILSADEVAQRLDAMAEKFPAVFFTDLNGGILLLEEEKPDPQFPPGEIYIMGEYIQDPYLGNSIHLYYGSFVAFAEKENWESDIWEDELYTTLAHELTHHVEGLANAHALDDKDAEEFLLYFDRYEKK